MSEIVINEGTASLGDDFTIIPSPTGTVSKVTFTQGESEMDITIDTENDNDIEGSETFTLTLRDPLYPQGNRANPYTLTVSIVDNDGMY